MITQSDLSNPIFSEPRKIWIQRAIVGTATDCLIVLDAEIYINSVKAPDVLQRLQEAALISPIDCVYLSSPNSAARHNDFACNEAFARFITTDLIQWITQSLQTYKRFFVCGLSLSGLCAIFTALRYPTVFSGIISQSPSAWWNDEWLAASIPHTNTLRGRIWMSVGDKELESGVAHAPTGMLQNTTQIASVHHLADELKAICKHVHYTEFPGGHDTACWAAELPEALIWTTHNAMGRLGPCLQMDMEA